jgi:F0F1-type ATP synthase membrane subunit b/b'
MPKADVIATPAPAAGTAMQQAVAAEQQARRAIAAAAAQAQTLIEQARARARLLVDQAPARIARLRERRAHAVEQALSLIQAQEATAIRQLQAAAIPADVIEAAVQRLTRWLTSADDDTPEHPR